jgi:hypothetical protein
LSGTSVALVNVGLVGLWLLLAAGIARRHKQLSPNDKQTK